MENERYMQEGLDLKRIVLLLMKKIWLVVLAVLAGAILGAGIYLMIHLVFAPEREYQSVSKVYLEFDCAPEDFNELSYNGYTWNDLLDTDPILNYAMEQLPAEISRDMVIEATKAEILSDIRLLTVTVRAGRPETAAEIMRAVQASLVHLGETDELFREIKVYSTTEPKQIVWDSRTVNAALTGAVLAFLFVTAAMCFYYVLDDSVYVQRDGEKKYGFPVFGIFTKENQEETQRYGNEFLQNYSFICKGKQKITLLSVDCEEDARKARCIMERIFRTSEAKTEGKNLLPEVPEDTSNVYQVIRDTEGVILVLRYGSRNGRQAERVISNLRKQECVVLGLLIVEAEDNFLKKYYMGKKDKAGKEKIR